MTSGSDEPRDLVPDEDYVSVTTPASGNKLVITYGTYLDGWRLKNHLLKLRILLMMS